VAHWNTKKRSDDKRGHRSWTQESKEKVRLSSMKHPLLNDKEWLTHQYVTLCRTTVSIANEIGCVNSTVFCALNRFGIPRRSRKQSAKNGKESHLWTGGRGFRSTTRYQEWRLMVLGRDGFTCQMCSSRGVDLHAHHVLSVSDFPERVYDVSNGMTLCAVCHARLHYNAQSLVKKGGELLGSLEQVISSQAETGMSRKVQRLGVESRTDSNTPTSAAPERDDIVCSH